MRLVLLVAAAIAAVAIATPVPAAPGETTPRINLSGLANAGAHDRFILKFRQGTAAFGDAAQRQALLDRVAAGRGFTLAHVRRLAIGADVIRASRTLDAGEAEAWMRALAADAAVEYIEVDTRQAPAALPNDPLFGEQWALRSRPIYALHADQAWEQADGAGVVVAVLDTGVTAHSDLAANLLPGYDFISEPFVSRDGDGRDPDPRDLGDAVIEGDCPGKPTTDSTWHGTVVAGVVAAVTNNAKGIAGVAPAAKILPVRILGKCGGETSDLVDAIVWAAGGEVAGIPVNAHPAKVINVSTAEDAACGVSLQRAVDFAVSRNVTVVAAAGNSAQDVAGFGTASCDNVIAVAASDAYGAPAAFSNHGNRVDVAAPGTNIFVLSNTGLTYAGVETYDEVQGTSVAAPMVAGVVALMQSRSPTPLSPAQVEAILKRNVTPFASAPAHAYGTGIVNAGRVLAEVTGVPLPPDEQTVLDILWDAIFGVGPPNF